jgi:hypothetical protein
MTGCTYLQSINSNKNLRQSLFTGQLFYMTTFCFGADFVNYSMGLPVKKKTNNTQRRRDAVCGLTNDYEYAVGRAPQSERRLGSVRLPGHAFLA